MIGKDECKLRPEPASRSHMFCLFGQGNLIFFLPGKSQVILKSDVCDNHASVQCVLLTVCLLTILSLHKRNGIRSM